MREIELVLALLAAVGVLVTLARRVQIPYPILLVLGGLGLSLTPGLPRVTLEPDLALLLFLPPILFAAAEFTSLRDFRANLRPIGLHSIGLVLFTTLVVALLAHALIPGLGWPAAFALGAIVAPPDAIAATAVAQRLGVPRRLITVLEGESLVNDATALVAYRMALGAAATGMFSLAEATWRFVLVAVGGILVGLVVGWLVVWLWRQLHDPPVEVLISLIAPFAAYLPAEMLGASGVLATVAAGLYSGRHAPRALGTAARVQSRAFWQTLIFLINGLVFTLIGLQLAGIVERFSVEQLVPLLGIGVLVSLGVIIARIVWIFPATYLPRALSPGLRARDPSPPWQHVAILAWAGLRGVVSLAAVLALPLALGDGTPFPQRDLLILITFCVILATLVGQGLTLPWLIRRLGVGDDRVAEHEEFHAREAAVEAAVARIEQLGAEWPDHRPLIDTLRSVYAHRASHMGEHRHDGAEPALPAEDQELLEHRLIRHAVIESEREAVIALRDRGVINDHVLRRVERDLDLEELRMEA